MSFKKVWPFVLTLAPLLFVSYWIWEAYLHLQFRGPIPGAPSAPLVDELPDLIAHLSRSKTLSEGRAQYALDFFARTTTPVPPPVPAEDRSQDRRKQRGGLQNPFKKKDNKRAEPPSAPLSSRPEVVKPTLSEGRKLYDEAIAEQHGCIEYIRAALTRLTVKADSSKIASRLMAVDEKVELFVVWANSLEPERLKPVSQHIAVETIQRWLLSLNDQNEAVLKKLDEQLVALKMRPWSAMSGSAK